MPRTSRTCSLFRAASTDPDAGLRSTGAGVRSADGASRAEYSAEKLNLAAERIEVAQLWRHMRVERTVLFQLEPILELAKRTSVRQALTASAMLSAKH